MFRILSKKELDDMVLFYNYINFLSCPTDFAVASGLLDFCNDDNMICSAYYVNDSLEMINSKVIYINSEGKYSFISKMDKYMCGIRPALDYLDIKDKSNIGYIDNNIGYLEYGYFPKSIINKPQKYEDTGVNISLPTSKNMFGEPNYYNFPVYKQKYNYFIEYPIYGLITRVRDEYFYDGEKACFLIEPIRFWVDYKSNIAITQDVIIGGIPYKMYLPYSYDDYDDSDIFKTVKVISKDIDILTELIDGDVKIKRK